MHKGGVSVTLWLMLNLNPWIVNKIKKIYFLPKTRSAYLADSSYRYSDFQSNGSKYRKVNFQCASL